MCLKMNSVISGVVVMSERRILHIDMDAFFASVEQVRNPELKGKPLIIGGEKSDARGVVSTCSYEARAFGVHSAMSLSQAKRLCPQGIYMRGNFAHYREASGQVREVLGTVSPLVEMVSIDEAYVDVTGSQALFGGDDGIAAYIKGEIGRRTQLPCTIAITPNKLVSKIACDEAKPDGYLRIEAGAEAAFLRPLPVKKLPGVGPRTWEHLEALGIRTIGDLADAPEKRLYAVFGPGGHGLKRMAQGISTSPVETESIPKSISRETTFEEDVADWGHVEQTLMYLAERAVYTLREKGMETRRVTLKVRYSDFSTFTYAHSLEQGTCLDRDVAAVLRELIGKARACRMRVRLIGVGLTQLSFDQHQMALFGGEGAEKWERALKSVDALRDRHGFEVLRSGRSMGLGKKVKLSNPSLSR